MSNFHILIDYYYGFYVIGVVKGFHLTVVSGVGEDFAVRIIIHRTSPRFAVQCALCG